MYSGGIATYLYAHVDVRICTTWSQYMHNGTFALAYTHPHAYSQHIHINMPYQRKDELAQTHTCAETRARAYAFSYMYTHTFVRIHLHIHIRAHTWRCTYAIARANRNGLLECTKSCLYTRICVSIEISWNGLGFPSGDSRAHIETSPDGVVDVPF